MARKRIELTPEQASQIASRTKRGQSLDTIAKATGLSRATVQRRQKELKEGGWTAPSPSAPSDTEMPEAELSAEELANVDKWIPVIEKMIEHAFDEKNHTDFNASMSRLIALQEHKRKATPLPKIDPNDSPDMVAAAARVRKMWHDLIDKAAK